jgi:hypothetical protein
MHLRAVFRRCAMCTLTIAPVLAFSAEQAYKQTDLDSDIQGLAQNPPNGQADTQLVNPWGLIARGTQEVSPATGRSRIRPGKLPLGG